MHRRQITKETAQKDTDIAWKTRSKYFIRMGKSKMYSMYDTVTGIKREISDNAVF